MQRIHDHIFLFDGLGAVASTSATAFLLPAVQPWIGLPRNALFALAVPAAGCAVYSLSCWLLSAPPARWLIPILLANLSYCVFVGVLLAWFADVVTPLGWSYFAVEVVIIGMVIALERRVLQAAQVG
ncbi:MAG: hypothetical protein KC621_27220 [Myxococcales bacterium]|nr:hypothetical protein [Myxococcales bacterium]